MNEYPYLRWLVNEEHDPSGEIEAVIAEVEELRFQVRTIALTVGLKKGREEVVDRLGNAF